MTSCLESKLLLFRRALLCACFLVFVYEVGLSVSKLLTDHVVTTETVLEVQMLKVPSVTVCQYQMATIIDGSKNLTKDFESMSKREILPLVNYFEM